MTRSQICQSGDAHLPATRPKFRPCTPSPTIRLENRCVKMRTNKIGPEMRIKSHLNISRFELEDADFRKYFGSMSPLRGAAMFNCCSVVMRLTSQYQHHVANKECAEHNDPQNHDGPQHLTVVLGALLPEVDQYNTDAVKRVIDHRGHESRFTDCHEPVFIRANDGVVGFG